MGGVALQSQTRSTVRPSSLIVGYISPDPLDRVMPIWRLRRHVVYEPGCAQTKEVWGIDRSAPGLEAVCAPRDTDRDDPLAGGESLLLRLDGEWVTWRRIWEWISVAENAGYEVVSDFAGLSPYSTIIIRHA